MERISVVIATRNRRDLLLQTLERMRAAYPGVPLIVVDNGSDDGTPRAVRFRYPGVQLIEAHENLGSYARTLGVRQAQTDFVAFCDDDTCWDDLALHRAVEIFDRHPRLALLCGKLLVAPDMRVDGVCKIMERSPLPREGDMPGPPVMGFLAGAAVVRRTPFLTAGGFHRRYGIGGEEELLAIDLVQLGWRLCYVDDIVAYHAPARGGRDPYRRRATQLRNRLWTAWLRRPLYDAAAITCRTVARNAGDRATWTALREAMNGLSWVRRERQVCNGSVRAQLRMLE